MTKEELLRPRYKIIADYPDNKNKVGDIITIQTAKTKGAEELVCGWYEKYPAIFERLPWWKGRKVEDMPPFLKEDDSLYKRSEVVKVKEWMLEDEETDCPCFMDEKDNHFTWVRGFLPATREEYEVFLQTTNQLNDGNEGS